MQVSSDGACCSVVWSDEGEFAIYRPASAGDAWDRLDGGAGIAVAWAAAAPLYAVIHTPRVSPADCHLIVRCFSSGCMQLADASH